MKKTLIIFISFVAVAAMIFALGCSKKTENPAAPAATHTPTVPAATATPTTPASTATPTAVVPTATSTPIEVPVAMTFDFATDQTSSWVAKPSMSALTWDSTAGDGNNGSTGCLQVTYAGTGTQTNSAGTITYEVPWGTNNPGSFGEINMTGQTIDVWINVPAGMVNNFAINFDVQQDTKWNDYTNWVPLTAAGWQEATFPLSASAMALTGGDITKVNQIVIQVLKTADASPDFSGTLLFDDISWQ